ncbi:glycosyltransferase family 4 protein [Dactylosporangium aurantiacum]|uniref:Glycosyltransferase family 4 protein n=1 Tax=Dactylosporangium aurantiacum TaxID=35754 RepID=A0A9Q9IHW5_9ACTN|nr:glycosyltransferase family 4 protein [Dactylosporangium aurantiacum]MDG6106043.1 glycosyltransferase family 4 protein [Dactylosporangium aurantiacum]UWZ55911.1 glycosyltransferase family 4 protein [Dactylosporangium aurantiacum]
MKDPRLHVVIAVANLPVERDRRVIREVKALEAAGYRVTVICPRGVTRITRVPGTVDAKVRSYRMYESSGGAVSFAVEFAWSFVCIGWHLMAAVVRDRAVAAQVCNPPDVFFPLALLMRMLGRPWVFDHHDLSPEVYQARGGRPGSLLDKVLLRFEKWSQRAASAVVSTNESYRELAISRGGCDPSRVVVVRNGPSAAEVKPVASALSDIDDHTIVYLGVLGAQDGVDNAILAAERLVELRGRLGWRLVVAGDGECLESLKALTVERKLEDVVEFTGWLGVEEIDRLLRTASVGLQPDPRSAHAEVSTMAKTVEYLARGLPVVGVDMRETRRSAGDAGVYVEHGTPEEFAGALHRLLDDPVARASMRNVALARFRNTLAWEHQAAAYVRLWDELLSTRRERYKAGSAIIRQAGPADVSQAEQRQ